MNMKATECESMNWILLGLGRFEWRALSNRLMYLWVALKARNFFTSLFISFSVRTTPSLVRCYCGCLKSSVNALVYYATEAKLVTQQLSSSKSRRCLRISILKMLTSKQFYFAELPSFWSLFIVRYSRN